MTASPITTAFRSLPSDIRESAEEHVGQPRPMSHAEVLLAVGQAIMRERERCAVIVETASTWPEPNDIAEAIRRGAE